MQAIILAAGMGRRLGELTRHNTKCMISVNGRTLIDRMLTQLSALNLKRVSAPLFVTESSGLNDNLNGVERPVSFDIPAVGANAQIVHSLAKWKRLALKIYNFEVGEGLYTDMNAIRRDEELDNLHSVAQLRGSGRQRQPHKERACRAEPDLPERDGANNGPHGHHNEQGE